jgi:hypothetical protein
VPDGGAGVVLDGGIVDATVGARVEASFTGVVGTEVSDGAVTEPTLRLVADDDELLDGSDAGTTPLLPVEPSQRPWQKFVLDPEPVVPGCRP